MKTLANRLLVAVLLAGLASDPGLAGPVISPSKMAGAGTGLLIFAAKRAGGQRDPHHNTTTPDRPPGTVKPNAPRPRQPPKHHGRIREVRKVNVICIDGRPARQTCQCRKGARAKVIKPGVFQCLQGSAAVRQRQPATVAIGSNQVQSGLPQSVPDEILVTVSLAASLAVDDAIARRHGLQRLESWPIALLSRRVVRYRIADGRPVDAVLAAMRLDGDVVGSQPNYLYARQGQAEPGQNATLQYALTKLDVVAAHRIARGNGTTLAIVDSGIDASHPDLTGTVLQTFATTPDAGTLPLDPHGTEIAGIAVAHGLLEGVAPGARLLDVRVFDYDGGKAARRATSISLLRGLDWASAQKATIINMSLAGPEDPLLHDAIVALVRSNHVIVAAAGNGGGAAAPSYPAAYEEVIAVTATDLSDALYNQASHGSYIDVAAPGVDVLSPSLASSYSMVSGTSFAAAHVSGIVALMLSRKPGMSAAEIRLILGKSAVDLGAPGIDDEFGAGLVSALHALQ